MSVHALKHGEELSWGIVKWYSEDKGYGWVTLPGGECDVFIHATQLKVSGVEPPAAGDRVGCLIRKGDKGWYAVNITVEGA